MLKKAILTFAAVGLFAGAASAADLNVNIYGASAQYKFWSEVTPKFLEEQGCAAGTVQQAKGDVAGNDHYIATCTAGSDTLTVRVTEFASAEGVLSVQDLNTNGIDTDCGNDGQRKMAATATFATAPAMGTVNTIDCTDVTVGSSDVAAETFNQESHGDLLGPNGGAQTDRVVAGLSIDPTQYDIYRPVVVPFSFFVNNGSDKTSGSWTFTATPVPVDNISRLQAVSLYSGQVKNWNKFDPAYPSLETALCLRHAGSGTHATLDAAVMRGDNSLVQNQATPGDFFYYDFLGQPLTYFNNSSTDEMKCVGQVPGAIGYADSDKIAVDVNYEFDDAGAKYGKIKKIQYQGHYAERDQIINGDYNFWAAQWLYSKKSEDPALVSLISALNAFASNPVNLALTAKANWWAAQDEMKVQKATDFALPTFK